LFDSFLYGYGLTLFVIENIKSLVSEKNPCKRYLDLNVFLYEFINSENHAKILRDFNSYFNLNSETNEAHDEARNFLKTQYEDILRIGFERWVSKNLYNKNNEIPKVVLIYVYFLYNYWYNLIHNEILIKGYAAKEINQIGETIKKNISYQENIFTTNFDPILDDALNSKHLHGRFIIPLLDLEQIIIPEVEENRFEYSYLFGTSGFEKAKRLNDFNNMKQNFYDLGFFFKNDLYLGHLLIFGLSFSRAEVLSESYLNENPQYENMYLAKSIDGHILLSMKKMFEDKRLTKISVTYYSENEKAYLEELFQFTEYKDKVELVDYKELFFS